MVPIPLPSTSQDLTGRDRRGVRGGAVAVRPAWAVAPVRKLGRYLLGPQLGCGGMGEIHEAWDPVLGRPVALKCLTVPAPAAIIRFLREAQIQARISHPGVCRIFDVEACGEVPFIAMQLVRGPNLFQAAPDLEVRAAVEILHAVALAVNAAHRMNLVHRDLKPSNILLEPDGLGGWSTYVADFGLALDLAGQDPGRTQTALGTPEYMAPEQRGLVPGGVGPAADIYALGATLRKVLERGMEPGHPGPPSRAAAVPPREIQAIIRRCLEERPADRYRSAGELAEDLRRYLDGEPLLAQQGLWRRRLRTGLRRHPALAASLGMFLVLGTGSRTWNLQVGARVQRQADVVQQFALDTQELSTRLRLERLIPRHDMRPAMAALETRLERIHEEMAHLGPDALGPGRLALGWGYLGAGQVDRALGVLDAAWRSGYTTPDVAYALVLAHTERDVLRAEDPTRPLPAGPAGGDLVAARSFLQRAQGETWEPLDLGEAALLVQEGRYAQALVKARRVFQDYPWKYRAKIVESRALTGMGRKQLEQGDWAGAMNLFREAGLAAKSAQAVGNSDEACYLASLEPFLAVIGHGNLGSARVLALCAEAERAVDQALIIRPDSPRAVTAKARIMFQRAAVLARAGRDPDVELRRVERFLAPREDQPGLRELASLQRQSIQGMRAEFRKHPR